MGEHWSHSVEELDLEWTKILLFLNRLDISPDSLSLDLQYLELSSLPLSIDN